MKGRLLMNREEIEGKISELTRENIILMQKIRENNDCKTKLAMNRIKLLELMEKYIYLWGELNDKCERKI